MSPTYDAVGETIGKGPGLAPFAIGISAVAQPELYRTDHRDHRRGRGVALRVRGALLAGERGRRHGCVVARLERDVVRTGAKACLLRTNSIACTIASVTGASTLLQREVRDDQEVGLPRSTVDGGVACSGGERLQACDRRRRLRWFAHHPPLPRPRRPPATRRRLPARSRARSLRTASVCASMRKTLPSTALATQSAPSPNESPLAERPAATVCVCRGGPGWIRQTVPASGSPTHTDEAPTAIVPTSGVASGIRCVTFSVTGSMRCTPRPTLAQIDPSPAAREPGAVPSRTVFRTRRVSGSSFRRRSSGPPTQTAPSA